MKYIPFFILIIVVYIFIGNIISSSTLIPDDAIRVRVIANSNSKYDQNMKTKVKDKVQMDMYNLLKRVKGTNQARTIINTNLDIVNNDVSKVLKDNNYNINYDINFGYNYFPAKEYKGVKYDEGYYESLVITLGEGKGDNWWCVLFPPLCLIEAENSDDIQYTTVVNEIIDKYK